MNYSQEMPESKHVPVSCLLDTLYLLVTPSTYYEEEENTAYRSKTSL